MCERGGVAYVAISGPPRARRYLLPHPLPTASDWCPAPLYDSVTDYNVISTPELSTESG